MTASFKNIFYIQATLITTIVILFFGRDIFIPACFGLLIAFILYPIVKWLNKKGLHNILSISLSMTAVFVFIGGIISLFSAQIINIADQYNSFLTRLKATFEKASTYIKSFLPIDYNLDSAALFKELSSVFSESGFSLVSNTLGYTSTFLSYTVLTIVFTFLILLYRKHLVNAIQKFGPEEDDPKILQMFKKIQKVGQQYLTGMLLLILILGTLNSVGLILLGIDYALFFGFLAALLAIIPYIGTAIGGLLPALYAFITYDSYWYPIGVILIFWFVQFLEGNYLNPKIVGGSLHINALFSIIALIAGGLLWGIAGMILFLPFTAVFKVICSFYDNLKPVSELIGDPSKEKNDSHLWNKIISVFQKN